MAEKPTEKLSIIVDRDNNWLDVCFKYLKYFQIGGMIFSVLLKPQSWGTVTKPYTPVTQQVVVK